MGTVLVPNCALCGTPAWPMSKVTQRNGLLIHTVCLGQFDYDRKQWALEHAERVMDGSELPEAR